MYFKVTDGFKSSAAGRAGMPEHVDRLPDSYCHDCRFYGKHTNTCDYYLAKGAYHRRPCHIGKDCTVKEFEIRLPNGKRSRWNPEEARKLYDQGMTDVEIAKATGTTSYTIGYWRRRNGLPTQKPHKPANRNWDKAEARRLYDLGVTDIEIAKAVDVKVDAVRKWRKKEGLPNNGKKK